MKKRLIDAIPFMKAGWHLVRTGKSNEYLASLSLADVPTVDAVEVVHGRWHDIYQVSSWCSTGRCSACEQVAILPIRGLGTPYCPNCGAKMDLEK